MGRYKVTKTFEFSYGHRLLEYAGKCRHLHGHNGMVEIDIEADALDGRGMVMDFSDISTQIKAWVDEHLDHKMLLSSQDPAVPVLTQLGEPLYLLSENPTAENISKLIFQQARSQGLSVSEVRLWETSTAYASYRES